MSRDELKLNENDTRAVSKYIKNLQGDLKSARNANSVYRDVIAFMRPYATGERGETEFKLILTLHDRKELTIEELIETMGVGRVMTLEKIAQLKKEGIVVDGSRERDDGSIERTETLASEYFLLAGAIQREANTKWPPFKEDKDQEVVGNG